VLCSDVIDIIANSIGDILMSKVVRVEISEELVVKHLVIMLTGRLKLVANYESVFERLRFKLGEYGYVN